ncbi:MAG: NFACT family protein [Sulfuricurvum sp.]|jgi:predicted ribosome quality control (RQC) complex YloA/Tae2 family protein
MKFSQLEQIVQYLQRFKQINNAYRLSDTQIRLVFDNNDVITFEMRRDNPSIFLSPSSERGKMYQAPFDVLLSKRLGRSTIQSITLHNNDKLIRIVVSQSGSYKSEITMLQFEFTGKHTNAILLDREEKVLEALRHVDADVSVRTVRVGQILINPPLPSFTPIAYPIDDVRMFLQDAYAQYSNGVLERLKREKSALIGKRLEQFRTHLAQLDDEKILSKETLEFQHLGHLVLANLHSIKGYATHIKLDNFDGTPIEFDVPPGCRDAATIAQSFFKRSKKAKQKGLGLHQERENLEEKVRHLELFTQTIGEAKTPEEIALLFPPKLVGTKSKPTAKPSDSVAEFWIEGHKVSLGKSEKGNIQLLQNSKARDIWLHLKDRPSAHAIITTDKQQLNEKILQAAAKLCVDFSVFEKGRYLVDYTPRREVKVQNGANVLYTGAKTIMVDKG